VQNSIFGDRILTTRRVLYAACIKPNAASKMIPSTLSVALKEWAVVCQALETGAQMILLRKGGIVEAIGGFELEHSRFLLFPTYLHQNVAMLKSAAQAGITSASSEPEQIKIQSAAEVTDIVRLSSRGQMDALDAEHIWGPALIDMRFNYRPKNPLYLLIVRAYRLAAPVTIQNTPDYAGCKSWVPLAESISSGDAEPAIGEAMFSDRRQRIMAAIHWADHG
jgi:hypothetical protein